MLQENNTQVRPPRIVETLVRGFNIVAANPYLMLFPLALDLFFWFGPFYRIKELLTPLVNEMLESFTSTMAASEVAPIIEATRESWNRLLDNFNLLSSLRTFPVGVPSLLATRGGSINPVGVPLQMEVSSSTTAVNIIIVSVFIGLLLGGIYYALISRVVTGKKATNNTVFFQISQSYILFFLIIVILSILSLPILCFVSSITVFLPSFGSLPLIVLGAVLAWLLLPLLFSPHAIFTRDLNATKAITLSARFVRISSIATSFFLLILALLSLGMDALWSTPDPNSWLMLIGIFGHAFISTGLVAASFVYFREGTLWMEEMVKLQPKSIG